jgi:pimeloyl-ACP methyl ester carboxylesterase
MKIVFLHGFPDNAEVWSYQAYHFDKSYTCVAPTIHSWKFEDQLFKLKELIGTQEVILVAHDMGGPVAVEYAQTYPDQVRHLVLINTMGLAMFAHRLKRMDQVLKSSYMTVFFNPLVNTFTLKPFIKHFLKLAYDAGGVPKDDPLRQNSFEVLNGLARYKEMSWRVPKKLFEPGGTVMVRTTFIFGNKDPFLIAPELKELQRFFAEVELHVISAGHWPMRSHPAELNDILQKIFTSSEIKEE